MVQFYLDRRLYAFGYICTALLQTCFANVIEGGLGNFFDHTKSFNTTRYPSASPSMKPSSSPTPTMIPTVLPSFSPTKWPSSKPSVRPTSQPTISPSDLPSSKPSKSPSFMPSRSPSNAPSFVPTTAPSVIPTQKPSVLPSSSPTLMPSFSALFPFNLNQYDSKMSKKKKAIFEETITDFASKCVDDGSIKVSSSHVESQELDGSTLKLKLRVDGMCLHSLKDTVQQSIVGCFDSKHNELTSQYEQRASQEDSEGTGWIAVVISLLFAAFVGIVLLIYRRRKIRETQEVYEFSPHRMGDLDIPRLDTQNGQVVSGDEEGVMASNTAVGTKGPSDKGGRSSTDIDADIDAVMCAGDSSSSQTEMPFEGNSVYYNSAASSVEFPGGFHVTKSAAEAASNLPPALIGKPNMANMNSLMDTDSTVASSQKSGKSVSTADVEEGACCFMPYKKRDVKPKENFVDNPSASKMEPVLEEEVHELRRLPPLENYQTDQGFGCHQFTSNRDTDGDVEGKIDVYPSLHRICGSTAQKYTREIAVPSNFYDGTISRLSSAGLLLSEDGEKLTGLKNWCSPHQKASSQTPVIDQASPPASICGYRNRLGRNDQTIHNRNAGDMERVYMDKGEPDRGHDQDVEEGPLQRNHISDYPNIKSSAENDESNPQFEHKYPGRGRMATISTGHEGELVPVQDFDNHSKNQGTSSQSRHRSEPTRPPKIDTSPPLTPRASRGRTTSRFDHSLTLSPRTNDPRSPDEKTEKTIPISNVSGSKSRSRSLSPPDSYGSRSSHSTNSSGSSHHLLYGHRARSSPKPYDKVYSPDRREWVESKH